MSRGIKLKPETKEHGIKSFPCVNFRNYDNVKCNGVCIDLWPFMLIV